MSSLYWTETDYLKRHSYDEMVRRAAIERAIIKRMAEIAYIEAVMRETPNSTPPRSRRKRSAATSGRGRGELVTVRRRARERRRAKRQERWDELLKRARTTRPIQRGA